MSEVTSKNILFKDTDNELVIERIFDEINKAKHYGYERSLKVTLLNPSMSLAARCLQQFSNTQIRYCCETNMSHLKTVVCSNTLK